MKLMKKLVSSVCIIAIVVSTVCGLTAFAATDAFSVNTTVDGKVVTAEVVYNGIGENIKGITLQYNFADFIGQLTANPTVTKGEIYDAGLWSIANAKFQANKAVFQIAGEESEISDGTVVGTITFTFTNDIASQIEIPASSVKISGVSGNFSSTATNDALLLENESIVVKPAAPSSPITAKNETVGTYNGKTLKLIAEVLDTVDASKKVAIVKNGTERQESGRTLAQIVNGVAVGGNSITGKLAVGVLTTDVDAVFTFELY